MQPLLVMPKTGRILIETAANVSITDGNSPSRRHPGHGVAARSALFPRPHPGYALGYTPSTFTNSAISARCRNALAAALSRPRRMST